MMPQKALALDVMQLRFGNFEGKTRLVLELNERSEFRTFVLANPTRMVIDLPEFRWRAGTASAPPSAGITAVRYGNLQTGISRIVFDLNKPIAIKNTFVLPRQNDKPARLVIDYSEISASAFPAEINKIHGTLKTSGQAPAQALKQDPYNGRTATTDNNSPIPPDVTQEKPNSVVIKPLIVIDPGHGGVDPGAAGVNKTHEKNVTLALAKDLKNQLEGTGLYRVMLTRDTDIFIKLRDRVTFARDNSADLFISIHADSIGKSNVSGVSVYSLSEKASDEQTAKLAARENRADLIAGIDLSVEDEEVAGILVDLAMRDTMNQSNFVANKVVEKLQEHQVTLLERPHRSAGFAVLKAPDIPSILVETGFMSNKREAELLNSPAYRKKIALGLADAISAYFEQVRKNHRI